MHIWIPAIKALTCAENAQLAIAGPKPLLAGLILEPNRADEILGHPGITTTGDTEALHELAEVIDTFAPTSTSPPLERTPRKICPPPPDEHGLLQECAPWSAAEYRPRILARGPRVAAGAEDTPSG